MVLKSESEVKKV